jgi:hypothetical protein
MAESRRTVFGEDKNGITATGFWLRASSREMSRGRATTAPLEDRSASSLAWAFQPVVS